MVSVSVEVPAPIEDVWRELADLPAHVEWMADARRIDFRSSATSGPGTLMAVETRLGPLRTTDLIEVVAWEPPRRMQVAHRGTVSGKGEFLLEPTASGTRVTWRESLRFPWFLGGSLGERLARPILRRSWRQNLARFRRRFEAR